MTLKWTNLTETQSYTDLRCTDTLANLKNLLTAQRIKTWQAPAGGGLTFHYAAAMITDTDIDRLQALANEQQLIEKYQAILSGQPVNTGEDRKVLHHLTRGPAAGNSEKDNANLRGLYVEESSRIRLFTEKVHAGEITGSTGKPFDTVVQIGIGGSDLGPRALHLALKQQCPSRLTAHFVSNVDPDDAAAILPLLNPETTLFILVSKSGTTQETLTNRDFILQHMKDAGINGYNPARHIVAVTSKTSPLANSADVLESFYIDDFIGGRYSSTSAVGAVVLSLAYGFGVFEQLLQGAHEADVQAMEASLQNNAALMDAMIGVFNRNILELPVTAVLPYSQALALFPAHLQQLDMESNGKSVNRRGKALDYPTGPVVFGEPGTNGQHSFYQLLHQGTDIVPLQFIGFRQSQSGQDVISGGSSSQTKLNANLAAQIIAFAKGRAHENSNRSFDGMRPSTLLSADRLTPRTLGALLAHFENKIMFQGFCWNINSFDQEGVQLGKILTAELLSGKSEDEALKSYAEILGIQPG